MPSEKIDFMGHDGVKLAARLDTPEGKIRATAIFAHCFSCSKDIPAAKRISSKLAALGIAVLRFDFTGLGHSDGEFSNTNFSSNIQDIVKAAEHLATIHPAPSLLIGHSLGGAAVLAAAHSLPSVKAITTIGAPANPEHLTHLFSGELDEIESKGHAQVDIGGRPFEIKKQFVDDLKKHELGSDISKLKRALLVLHSPIDEIVGISNAADIFSAAKHPKSFVSLDNANHLITNQQDAEYIASLISSWAERYLDLPLGEASPEAPEGIVRVSEVTPEHFTQDVLIDARHQLLADEPPSVGGRNLGPTPYQYVSAGLGACTSMTIRLYARRKGIALDHVYVDVSHEKEYAPEDTAQRIDVFTRHIKLTGNFDEEQRQSMLRIADLCPVHKTLEAEAHIVTKLV